MGARAYLFIISAANHKDNEPIVFIIAHFVDASEGGYYVNSDSRGDGGIQILVTQIRV